MRMSHCKSNHPKKQALASVSTSEKWVNANIAIDDYIDRRESPT